MKSELLYARLRTFLCRTVVVRPDLLSLLVSKLASGGRNGRNGQHCGVTDVIFRGFESIAGRLAFAANVLSVSPPQLIFGGGHLFQTTNGHPLNSADLLALMMRQQPNCMSSDRVLRT
jgi:hypothetical protein